MRWGLLFTLVGVSHVVAAEPRSNIVVLLADDLGYGELGCYGGTEIPTPHIDSLAREGVRFTSGYVTAPVCAPSRAGLLTGRYQQRFGFDQNAIGAANADPNVGLPTSESTLADALRNAGYATGLVGKWHQGGTAKFHPQRRGFDEFFGFLHEGHYYVPPPWEGVTTWLRRTLLPDGSRGRWTSPNGRIVWTTHMGHREPDYDADNPLLRNSQPVDEREHLTDAFTREAESFIERHRSQPFFLMVTYNAVHSPMQGADRYLARFAHIEDIHRRIFAAMLAQLDDSVGRILAKLRDCELERRTLVVFLSDNGGPTRELTSRNDPLRGGKGQLYEGGIRVPFLMRWPGAMPANVVEDRMVSALDLFPTALAAAGAGAAVRDGVDLRTGLSVDQSKPLHEQFYWRYGSQAALRERQWKVVRLKPDAEWQLFDLNADLSEARDVASMHPDIRDRLSADWTRQNDSLAASKP